MANLAEYVRGKQEDQSLLDANAAQMREDWQCELERLMSSIDGWLSPAVEAGLKLTRASVTIAEQGLGAYDAPLRIIELAGNRVKIVPKARLVVGGYGRVDVEARPETALLIYWKPEGCWYILRNRDWRSRELLSQDSFERLMEAFL
jgi:hypothetical protein